MRSFKKQTQPTKLHRAGVILLCAIIAAGLLGCSEMPAPKETIGMQLQEPQIKLTNADMDTGEAGASSVDLNKVERICRIDQPGTYILSGELWGSIQIDVQDQIVRLILNGVTVNATTASALEVISAGKVILTVKDGTTNSFKDTAEYLEVTEADACIYSPCDLTINGGGTLNVTGYFKDAIHTKDILKILNGNCFVQSKRDGLHGNDGIVVRCQALTVQSERNGLNSTKSGKPGKGNVEIQGSECSLIGGKYSISCAADLHIADSSVYMVGVHGQMQVQGASYIAEGSLKNA